jgi:dTDP-4-dehydrorhamnose reductase
MKTIWVTGSKGQLGTELLARQDTMPDFNFLHTDIDDLDLRDKDAVHSYIQSNKPDYIIHCAAYTAVDKAETDQTTAFQVNSDVPATLCRISKTYNCRIIHISTDYVFDGLTARPYKEEDPTNPQSVYGKSKLAGELEILKGKNHIVIRTSWLYSAHGNNFVKTILRIGKEKEEIQVVTDEIGSPTWAGDLAGAILHIIQQLTDSEKQVGGMYHYSNEGGCSRYEFAVNIVSEAGFICKVNPIKAAQYPLPAKRPPYAVFNNSKIKETFNLTIPEWKVSLEKCIDQLGVIK